MLLALPAVALAAPQGMDPISNELKATITVDEVDESIQGAIDRAGPGDTVRVPAGAYTENLVINKALTLTSDGGEVIINGHIDVAADDVTVSNLTVRRNESLPVVRIKGKNIVIQGNKIDGAGSGSGNTGAAGIQVRNGTDATINDNDIIDNLGNGIWVDLSSDDSLTITGNRIERNRTGMNYNDGTGDVTITGNQFRNNNAHGISIGASSAAADLTIQGNTFDGNVRSHYSDYSDNSGRRESVERNNDFRGPIGWVKPSETRWLLVDIDNSAIDLSWGDGTDGAISGNQLTLADVEIDEELTAVVDIEFGDGTSAEGALTEINNVLFVIEIDGVQEGDVSITADPGYGVRYAGNGVWLYGHGTGADAFSLNEHRADQSTEIKYSFSKDGTFNVTIYAVQVNQGE